MNRYAVFLSLLCGALSASPSEKEIVAEYLSRADQLPKGHIEESDDVYLEGYIQSLLNSHYYEFNIIVQVLENTAYLYKVPNNRMIKRSIVSFVSDVPGISDVQIVEGPTPPEVSKREMKEVNQIGGVWFPQTTVLFQPLIADPRETQYYAEYRWGDETLGTHTVGVAYGDTFPIYRWNNVFVFGGALQIGIQAGAWSVFNLGAEDMINDWAQLVNTDYLIGIPLTYSFDNWSFRLRIYHKSDHLGDEFIQDHPDFERLNPSMEAIDFIAQYQITDGLRPYLGPGVIVRDDETFRMDWFYIHYGIEGRAFGQKFFRHKLYGTPFIALDFQNWQAVDWRLSFSGMIGYEFSKLQGVGRKFRFYGKYHNGYSDGQFFKETSDFWAAGFSWGF